jgi:hypothetical protein
LAAATRARVNFMRTKVWDFKDAERPRRRIEFSVLHANFSSHRIVFPGKSSALIALHNSAGRALIMMEPETGQGKSREY